MPTRRNKVILVLLLLLFASCLGKHTANIDYDDGPSIAHKSRSQSNTISYQVHSYNDLREWPQILRKGTTYFKTDTHYMPSSFCTNQSQVPSSNSGSSDGCFVLSHDPPVSTRQYNSSYSILNFIADPQYASYYKNPTRRIYIALCFKLDTASPCDGSATAQNWTAATDLFFEAANMVVASKGLNVEFILDGSATPTDSNLCLINKWRPWVTTWIPGDSEAAPYSNNATLGLDRFQVFNPYEVPDVPGYYIFLWELQDYGKFSKTNYSYLIWEPSDQGPILDISDSYLDGPIHPTGLRFAINIDPVQLQVFAGSRSGTAWNYEIASSPSSKTSSTSDSSSPTTITTPTLAVITASSSSYAFYLISTFLDSKSNITYYTVTTTSSWSATQLGPTTTQDSKPVPHNMPIASLSSFTTTATGAGGYPYVFASQWNGNYAIFGFNETTLELSLVAQGTLLPCTNCKATAVFLGELSDFYVVQIMNEDPICSLQLQIWHLVNFTQSSRVGLPYCVQTDVGVVVSSYSLAFSSTSERAQSCSSGYLPGVVTFSDSSNQIYSSALCANIASGDIIANGGESVGRSVVVDVGTGTSVSMYMYNGQVMVLEVHSDGFCWNSEPNNKQPTPATCSNSPVSIPYILNYNFGSFDDWATHISNVINNKNQSYNLDSIFSSCHPTILHGAYDSGSEPQVVLFSAFSNNVEVLLHAEVHIGLPEKFSNASQCGFAVPSTGLVLDSWLLGAWDF